MRMKMMYKIDTKADFLQKYIWCASFDLKFYRILFKILIWSFDNNFHIKDIKSNKWCVFLTGEWDGNADDIWLFRISYFHWNSLAYTHTHTNTAVLILIFVRWSQTSSFVLINYPKNLLELFKVLSHHTARVVFFE